MKKFVLNIIRFILLLVVCEFVIIFIPSPASLKNSLYFSKIDKDSLLKFERRPRIIFVGGSNLSFGLNSKLIKDSLHINPINTGLHANLGLIYMMDQTLSYIQKDDLVILVPEYENFFEDYAYGAAGYELLLTTLEVSGGYFKLRAKQIGLSLKYLPQYTRAKINIKNYIVPVDPNDIYSRSSFNKFGDAKNHWNLPPSEESFASNGFGNELNHLVINNIKEFQNKVHSKGALLLFSFPCTQKTNSKLALRNFRDVEKAMNNTNIPMLGNPETFMFPESMMFNSTYHLTKSGATLRTLKLISELKPYISNNTTH